METGTVQYAIEPSLPYCSIGECGLVEGFCMRFKIIFVDTTFVTNTFAAMF